MSSLRKIYLRFFATIIENNEHTLLNSFQSHESSVLRQSFITERSTTDLFLATCN